MGNIIQPLRFNELETSMPLFALSNSSKCVWMIFFLYVGVPEQQAPSIMIKVMNSLSHTSH
jgi:hypothetical protein